jgi:hypothetical protein
MSEYCRNILLTVTAVGFAVLGGLFFFASARDIRKAITDPAVLATMPPEKLLDAEIDTLIRAAFRNADRVLFQAEGSDARRPREMEFSDRATLDSLADCFAVGPDCGTLPRYPYPGVMYTGVRIEGPYRLGFTFLDNQEIYLHVSTRRVGVATRFSKKIGDLLNLSDKEPPKVAP